MRAPETAFGTSHIRRCLKFKAGGAVDVLQKLFRYLTIFPALLLTGWGSSVAGILGALTGFLAPIGIGSALSIAVAGTELDPGLSRKTVMQCMGEVITAATCAVGVYYGGWRMGWLYGLGG